MSDEFWLSEEHFARLAPLLPSDTRGVARVDDRRASAAMSPVAADLVERQPASTILAADRAYDSDAFRHLLIARGTTPVIPNGPRRKNPNSFDRTAYKQHNLVESAFCRIKDFRRFATRYGKLAVTCVAVISLAAIVCWQ